MMAGGWGGQEGGQQQGDIRENTPAFSSAYRIFGGHLYQIA